MYLHWLSYFRMPDNTRYHSNVPSRTTERSAWMETNLWRACFIFHKITGWPLNSGSTVFHDVLLSSLFLAALIDNNINGRRFFLNRVEEFMELNNRGGTGKKHSRIWLVCITTKWTCLWGNCENSLRKIHRAIYSSYTKLCNNSLLNMLIWFSCCFLFPDFGPV